MAIVPALMTVLLPLTAVLPPLGTVLLPIVAVLAWKPGGGRGASGESPGDA